MSEYRMSHGLAFKKIEQIIKVMQQTVEGVPIRCQKVFLTTIPAVFTGFDLIEWLMDRFDITDEEALHIASLICQLGYFFPVPEVRTLSVKDDGALYRFQNPYYWPSYHNSADNTDYAVYLEKRLHQNGQRNALDSYEQDMYSKLSRTLSHKWDLIAEQAEDQLKLSRQRNRMDNVVVESQERAFWRIHQPPPGTVSFLENGPRKCHKVNHVQSVEVLNMKKNCLQDGVTRGKTKVVLNSFKCLLSFAESYRDHDPFLNTEAFTNPWISGDTTAWELSEDIVEKPTELRIKRWSISFKKLLADPTGKQEFSEFLEKEFSQENLQFWSACETLKCCPISEVEMRAQCIYNTFISLESENQINLDSRTLDQLRNAVQQPHRWMFYSAQEEIYQLMRKDSYTRFLNSESYKSLLANASQLGLRKLPRFLQFGASRWQRSANLASSSLASISNTSGSSGLKWLHSAQSSPSSESFTNNNISLEGSSSWNNSRGASPKNMFSMKREQSQSVTNVLEMHASESKLSIGSSASGTSCNELTDEYMQVTQVLVNAPVSTDPKKNISKDCLGSPEFHSSSSELTERRIHFSGDAKLLDQSFSNRRSSLDAGSSSSGATCDSPLMMSRPSSVASTDIETTTRKMVSIVHFGETTSFPEATSPKAANLKSTTNRQTKSSLVSGNKTE